MEILRKVRSNRNLTAATAILGVAIFYALQVITSWNGLISSGVRGNENYIDQKLTLKFARCFKKIGTDIYKVSNGTDDCKGYPYSVELLRTLNFLKLSQVSGEALGSILMWSTIATLCLIFFLIKNLGRIEYLISIAAFISPGLWLLFERGNYDGVMFCLVLIAGLLITTKYQEIGMIALIITVMMKFYTLPAYFFAILLLRKRISRYIFFIISIPLTLSTLYSINRVETFPSTWNVSFGIKSLGLYFQFVTERFTNKQIPIPPVLILIPGILLLTALLMMFFRINLSASILSENSDIARAKILYNLILVVFLSCYLTGMSFDYRLIFLAALLAISQIIFADNRFKSLMVISGLISLYCSTYLYGLHGIPALLIQFFGDMTLILFVATQLLYLKQNRSQLSYGFLKGKILISSKF